jgi:hypothetical protein
VTRWWKIYFHPQQAASEEAFFQTPTLITHLQVNWFPPAASVS